MTISWIIFLVIVAFCTFSGYGRGVFGVVLRVVGLVASYVVAILYFREAGDWLQQHTMIKGILSYVVAGIGLFIGTNLLLSFLSTLLIKFVLTKSERSAVVSVSGALVGFALGIFWGLLAVFTVSYVSQVVVKKEQTAVVTTKAQHNWVEKWAHTFTAKLVEIAGSVMDVDPTVGKMSAALVQQPEAVSQLVQKISKKPQMQQLLAAPNNQRLLQSGKTEVIAQLPEFQELIDDADFKEFMTLAGVDTNDKAAYEQEIAHQFSRVWRKVDTMKNDPRAVAIYSDESFLQRIREGDPSLLLTDKRFVDLLNILLEPDSGSFTVIESSVETENKTDAAPAENKTIYQWTDADGKKHYSDKEPE